jgi:hypothetical protein
LAERYTGGSGYPALGTFYQHVRHAGSIIEYMRQRFESDFEDALLKMSVADKTLKNCYPSAPRSLRVGCVIHTPRMARDGMRSPLSYY